MGWKYCASCGKQLGTSYIGASRSFPMPSHAPAVEIEVPVPSGTQEPAQEPPKTDSVSEAEAHNTRGREFFEAEDLEHAISEFEAAVTGEPGNGSYHCNLAVAYDEAERDEEALAEYEKTLQIDSNDLTALLSLGYMYNEGQQPDKAQEVWSRILKVAPDSAEAQEVRGNLSNQGKL